LFLNNNFFSYNQRCALRGALDIALSADHVSAEDALRMGLVSRLLPRAELLSAAEALAQRIASHAPLSVLLTKKAVRGSLDTDLPTGLRIEADLLIFP
jgi:enoyl-CoA hydratase